MTEGSTMYDASRIQVLEGREAIRKRPGMYIGSTGERGLCHMVFEIADRAVNEVLAGLARSIAITSRSKATVRDDGGGLSLVRHG
ncbi:hypothetical protein [Kitasatospora sp. NPDC093806]|uniref:hypothetical protein n=1 Tax=Kitasatospora sp. NPDC093806 TaxID=3155075 RepID=UPI00344923B4